MVTPFKGRSLRVLCLTGYYEPAFRAGGTVRSIVNLVSALSGRVRFTVITRAHDLGSKRQFAELGGGSWKRVGAAIVNYATTPIKVPLVVSRLVRKKQIHVLYLNSFFDPIYTFVPLILRKVLAPQLPVLIAPRGELSVEALSLKRVKKKLYLVLVRSSGLLRGACWHASSEYEAADIRRSLRPSASSIFVANDLLSRSNSPSGNALRDVPEILFVGRIARIKNLLFAIRCLQKVRRNLVFTVLGVVEDPDYWAICLDACKKLPENVIFQYGGAVSPRDVHAALERSSLFFVPSASENFGHAIGEALLAGVPVLIGDQTPWRNLNEDGLGWDLPLCDVEAFVTVLSSFDVSSADSRARRANTVRQRLGNDGGVMANLRMFESVSAAGGAVA